MLYFLRMFLMLLTVAVLVLALALTTTVTATSTAIDAIDGPDGPSVAAYEETPELVQTRGCLIWCWRR